MKIIEWLQIVVLGLGMSVVFAGWLLGYQETVMNKYEVMIKFRGEPRLTSYANAKNEQGAKFAVILEASMNGFDVSEIEYCLITKK